MLRILRLLKVLRHFRDTDILVKAIQLSLEALLVPLFFLVLGAIFFGAAVFYFEHIELNHDASQDEVGTEAFPDVGTGICKSKGNQVRIEHLLDGTQLVVENRVVEIERTVAF